MAVSRHLDFIEPQIAPFDGRDGIGVAYTRYSIYAVTHESQSIFGNDKQVFGGMFFLNHGHVNVTGRS